MKARNLSMLSYATVAVELFLKQGYSLPAESLGLLSAALEDMKEIHRSEETEVIASQRKLIRASVPWLEGHLCNLKVDVPKGTATLELERFINQLRNAGVG